MSSQPVPASIPPDNGHNSAGLARPFKEALPMNGNGNEMGRGTQAARLLWDQRRLLMKLTVRGLIVGTLIAFLIPTYYRSTTRLMPPNLDPGMGLAALSALTRGGVGFNLLAGNLIGYRSSAALFIGVLRSRTVEDQLINKFDLQRVYRARRMEDARKDLEWNTAISEDRQSGIITINVTDNDPRRAAEIARSYVEELNALLIQVNTSAAHKERLFLEDQISKVKGDLDQAAEQFSQFASANSAIDIPEQGKAMVAAAARVQGELIAAQSELRGTEQIYAPNNVRVRSLRARISELQSQLDKLGGTQDSSGDSERYPSLRKLPLLGVKYFDLYRQTKIQEAIYEALQQEYAMAKVQEAKELPNARVLDPSDTPDKKAGPMRTLVMFAGVLLSLLVGIFWILGKNYWQDIDSGSPGKQLAVEIGSTMRGRLTQISSSKAFSPARRLAARLARRSAPAT